MSETAEITQSAPMQCGTCNAVAAVAGGKFCMRCGGPLIQSAATPIFSGQSEGQIALSPPPKKPEPIFWSCTKILLVLLLACAAVVLQERGAPPAEQVGFGIGFLLIPTVVASLAARRKGAYSLQRFSNWFLICSFLLLFVSLPSALTHLVNDEPAEKKAGELMKEAAGVKPIERTGSADEERMNDAIRPVFHDMLQSATKTKWSAAWQPQTAYLTCTRNPSNRCNNL